MFKRIDHVEIIPQDIERTLNFYINVFGFKLKQRKKVEMPPMREVVFIELNDTVMELISVDNPKPPSADEWQVGYIRIALEVEDMDKAVEYLKSKGVEITWGPVSLGPSKRAEIKDPDGLSIELRQW
jgi:glyoxylase I family protein